MHYSVVEKGRAETDGEGKKELTLFVYFIRKVEDRLNSSPASIGQMVMAFLRLISNDLNACVSLMLCVMWVCVRTHVSIKVSSPVSRHSVGIHTGGWQSEDCKEQSSGPIQRRPSINISTEKVVDLSPPAWGCSFNYYFLKGTTVSPRCSSWYGVEAERPSKRGLSSYSSLCLDAELLFYSFRGSVWVFAGVAAQTGKEETATLLAPLIQGQAACLWAQNGYGVTVGLPTPWCPTRIMQAESWTSVSLCPPLLYLCSLFLTFITESS